MSAPLEVTLKTLDRSYIALSKLAGNTKLPSHVFFRVASVWKQTQAHIENLQDSINASYREHAILSPEGDNDKFSSVDARLGHEENVKKLLAETVEIRVKGKIAWNEIQAKVEKGEIVMTPAEVGVLDWLFDFGDQLDPDPEPAA